MTTVDRFFSTSLGEDTPYMVVIPDHLVGKSDVPYVHIVHGMTDDVTIWLRFTHLEELLESHGYAAALTFAENSYYTDMAHGKRYLSAVADDFPAFLAEKYGFSLARENRVIMGNSMGGYGAFKLALTYPDRYCAAVSLSGVTDLVYRFVDCGFWPDHGEANWGKDFRETLADSPSDLYRLIRDVEDARIQRPILRQICGTDDYLYPDNIRFRDFMRSRDGWEYTYFEDKGAHWWDFWDRVLPDVLDHFENILK